MLGKHREEGEEVLGLRVFFLRLRLFWKCRIHIFRIFYFYFWGLKFKFLSFENEFISPLHILRRK